MEEGLSRAISRTVCVAVVISNLLCHQDRSGKISAQGLKSLPQRFLNLAPPPTLREASKHSTSQSCDLGYCAQNSTSLLLLTRSVDLLSRLYIGPSSHETLQC